MQSPSLDYPIVLRFITIRKLTADRFMAETEQFNEGFVIDESSIFVVTLVDMPRGGSRKRCKFVNKEQFLHNKKCVIRIQNDDLCCARAIVYAKARMDRHEQCNSIRTGKSVQETMAKALHEVVGVALGICGVEEIKKLQVVMPVYQISKA